MDNQLNYQQARRLRGTSLGKVFADQLDQNSSVGGAIKKTISLKMQSQIKGMKERIDPLNIARFLTFGSSWAPALLGHLTGRSHEDTRYFSGRLKPIVVKDKSKKVTPLPKDGEQLVEGRNTSMKGLNKELMKIYKLIKKSNESDKKRREMENNFAEEKSQEAERRHKEFMRVLTAITGGESASVIVETGEEPKSPFEKIGEFLSSPVLRWAARFLTLDAFAVGLLALAPMAALWKITQEAESADINNPNGNILAETGKAGLEFSNWVDEKTGRSAALKEEQQQRNEERMTKGDPWEKKRAGTDADQLKALAPVIQNYEKMYTEAKPDAKKQIEPGLTQLYDQRDALIKKIGGVDAPGERIVGKKTATPVATAPKTQAKTTQTPAIQTPSAGGGRGVQGGATAEQSTGQTATPTTSPASSAAPVSAAPAATQQLNAAMAENADAQLPKQQAEDKVVVNNVVSKSKKDNRPLDRLSELTVRNDEPTLLRMIMASTRIV